MAARARFETVDLHVGGAPVRLVESGYPDLGGLDMAARSARARTAFDLYRRRLLLEPWGADGLEGALLTAPERPGSAAGLVPLSPDGYPPRSGRAALAAAAWLWRTGRAPRALVGGEGAGGPCAPTVLLDLPAGTVGVAITDRGEAAPEGRVANPEARVEAALGDAALVRAGEERYVVALAETGAIGLEPTQLGAVRLRLNALRAWAGRDGYAGPEPVAGWLLASPPEGDGGTWAVATLDRGGRLVRAPAFEALAAFAARLAALGRAAPGDRLAISGLTAPAVSLQIGAVGADGATASAVGARAFVIGLRRFVLDPDDEVEPFLLP